MSSGDVGHLDPDGLLYVSGRDDEMIVSSGENVFPAEVEDLISGHPDVIEATAIGVEDKDFGARLRAATSWWPRTVSSSTEETVRTTSAITSRGTRSRVRWSSWPALPRNPTGKILKRELRQIEVK